MAAPRYKSPQQAHDQYGISAYVLRWCRNNNHPLLGRKIKHRRSRGKSTPYLYAESDLKKLAACPKCENGRFTNAKGEWLCSEAAAKEFDTWRTTLSIWRDFCPALNRKIDAKQFWVWIEGGLFHRWFYLRADLVAVADRRRNGVDANIDGNWVTATQAVRQCVLSRQRICTLARQGKIDTREARRPIGSGRVRTVRLYSWPDIQRLLQGPPSGMKAIREIAAELGVKKNAIEHLIQQGKINSASKYTTPPSGRELWHCTTAEVRQRLNERIQLPSSSTLLPTMTTPEVYLEFGHDDHTLRLWRDSGCPLIGRRLKPGKEVRRNARGRLRRMNVWLRREMEEIREATRASDQAKPANEQVTESPSQADAATYEPLRRFATLTEIIQRCGKCYTAKDNEYSRLKQKLQRRRSAKSAKASLHEWFSKAADGEPNKYRGDHPVVVAVVSEWREALN